MHQCNSIWFKCIQCVGVEFCHPCCFLLHTEVASWYIGQELRRQMRTSIIHANHIVSLPKAGNVDHYWPDPSCKPLGTSTKSPMTKHNPTVRKYFQLQSSGHFGNASCGCPSGCICWSVDLITPKPLLRHKWVHTPTDLSAPGNMRSWWLPQTKRLHLRLKISVPHQ